MPEVETQELAEEELERVKKALSWNDGQGYDGNGPEDAFDIEEVEYGDPE